MNDSVVELAQQLVAIPSVSDQEQAVVEFVVQLAAERGWATERIPVQPGRDNVLIGLGTPAVLLSTHLDVVPADPALFSPRIKNEALYGRGACDAKGIAACMLGAAIELERRGRSGFGLLFVVGEEKDGIGAKAATKALSGRGITCIVNGEPTECRLVKAHKGYYGCTMRAAGRACHSGYPELGESAILKLAHVIVDLEQAAFPADRILGATTLNFGMIKGGVALNVLPPSAELVFSCRTVCDGAIVDAAIRDIVAQRASLEQVEWIDPVTLHTLPGFETSVVAYGSDIPSYLPLECALMMYGPGTIHVAHTDDEHVLLSELDRATKGYVEIIERLLGGEIPEKSGVADSPGS
ncbi:MAG: M20/M25/M40 family metallo-hydrolase [Bdellovibrionota bacterium]|nr:MAG: M20/M25/M40 family metallo-hydrolase [Bdellovibrionota bacterium]